MTTTGSVLQGLRDPRALEITVTPSTDVPDLSGVTAASLLVYRRDGSAQTWTCTITSQSASALVLVHPWVAGDNDDAGEQLHIYSQLMIGGQPVECQLDVVTVRPR